ncbi:hypothetical protein SISNIDRAFT_460996, partial [Sistotremastrum niveocremeum HHB9708]
MASNRAVKHAKKACNKCRDRKGRCDGENGLRTCSYCLKHGHECSFNPLDARGPSWGKATMEAYRVAIDDLTAKNMALQAKVEALTARLGGEPENVQNNAVASSSSAIPPASSGNTSESDGESLCDLIDRHLVLDDKRLVLHGGWSPFVSLGPSYPLETSGPGPIAEPEPPVKAKVQSHFVNHRALLHGEDRTAWKRHIPEGAILTRPEQDPFDPSEHDKICDTEMSFFLSWGMRLCPSLFWRDMRYALRPGAEPSALRTNHYSPFLHNALLAICTSYSDDHQIRSQANRDIFVNAAKAAIEKECQDPTIATVAGLSLLASYHSGHSEHVLGYVYSGIAVRVAMALGLNIGCRHWVDSGQISEEEMRDRYWGFWMIYSQDVFWSLYIGREFSINLNNAVLPLPSFENLPEDDMLWILPGVDDVPRPNLLREAFVPSCTLTIIATRIMNLIYRFNGNPRGTCRQFLPSLRIELQEWVENLGPELKVSDKALPNVLMMHIAYWWCVILLERPFYGCDAQAAGVSRKWCRRGVEHILKLVKIWQQRYTLHVTPITLTSALFGAATTNLLALSRASPRALKEKANYLAEIKECIALFGEIGQTLDSGKQFAMILQKSLVEKGLVDAEITDGTQPCEDSAECDV